METLPKVCPGYNIKSIAEDAEYRFQALEGTRNSTAVDFNSESIAYVTSSDSDVQQVSSFWMDQGNYNCEMTMYTKTSPDQKVTVYFDMEIELTWFMILVITVIYLVFLVIGVQAVISKDYF
jgi:hypothetical protein